MAIAPSLFLKTAELTAENFLGEEMPEPRAPIRQVGGVMPFNPAAFPNVELVRPRLPERAAALTRGPLRVKAGRVLTLK